MVAAPNGKQTVLPRPACYLPVLQGHFKRHFHAYRAGITEKNMLERLWRHAHQPLPQLHCRAMGEAAKHHMGHVLGLFLQGLIQDRMVIAVDGAPPGRHAVYQLAAIGQTDAHTLGRNHRVHRQRPGQGGVGVPEVVAVKSKGCLIKAMCSVLRHGAAPARRYIPRP